MYIENITIENFRNYENQKIDFNKNINIIYGNNAQGKTNIIEAIFLCSYGKSFRAKRDKELIKFNKEYSKVEVSFQKKDREGKINLLLNDKKTFSINGVKQTKISDIVGKINTVIFTPDDIDIIKGGPQGRRKFIDMMISSLKPNYIYVLNTYNKVLEERNNYLRLIKEQHKNPNDIEIWDIQLAEYAYKVYQYRKEYFNKIENIMQDIHNLITKSGKEKIEIKYINNTSDKEKYLEQLKKNLSMDIQRGYTSNGVHRDDFSININDKSVSTYGSQGQQRTTILTIKLCELNIVKEEIGESPILLLDDFMSELDETRRETLLDNIKDCQVIITCTDDININNDAYKFYVDNGICIKK